MMTTNSITTINMVSSSRLLLPCLLLLLLISLCFTSTSAANSFVSSSKSCYNFKENVVISFNTTKARVGDVIGISHWFMPNMLLTAPVCTIQTCNSTMVASSGTITIPQSLSPGRFKAYLLRFNKKTVVGASTVPFFIQRMCGAPTASPSKRPTWKPMARKPTLRPTIKSSMISYNTPTTKYYWPTYKPTSYYYYYKPTSAPTKTYAAAVTAKVETFDTSTANGRAHMGLSQARDVIAQMVQANNRLTPLFLRMGFHDCITVCDGCIDLSNPDNTGLEPAIAAINPVVEEFANNETGLSRADIWALATTVAVDVAPHGAVRQPISFTMPWYGRVDCENARSECVDHFGNPQPCSATAGPSRSMANPNFNTVSLHQYFNYEFGFDPDQVVAIMGAHSVGHMVPAESGFDAPIGWGLNNTMLQNEYYQALIGLADSSVSDDRIYTLSPKWVRIKRNNSGTIFPDRHSWTLTIEPTPFAMLDADISLVRDINPSNQDPVTGEVFCAYNQRTNTTSPNCPLAPTVHTTIKFAGDNDLWLNAFKSVLDLMLTNGYTRDTGCTDLACPLTMIPGITFRAPLPDATGAPTSSPTKSPTSAPSQNSTTPRVNQTSSIAPGNRSDTLSTVPPNRSDTLSTIPPNRSDTLSTIPPNRSDTLSTIPPNRSDTLSTVPPNRSDTLSTVPPNRSATLSTIPPNQSATLSTIPPNRSATLSTIPPGIRVTISPTILGSNKPVSPSPAAPVPMKMLPTESPTVISPAAPTGSPSTSTPILDKTKSPLSVSTSFAPVGSSPTTPTGSPSTSTPILEKTKPPLSASTSVAPIGSSTIPTGSPTTSTPIFDKTQPPISASASVVPFAIPTAPLKSPAPAQSPVATTQPVKTIVPTSVESTTQPLKSMTPILVSSASPLPPQTYAPIATKTESLVQATSSDPVTGNPTAAPQTTTVMPGPSHAATTSPSASQQTGKPV